MSGRCTESIAGMFNSVSQPVCCHEEGGWCAIRPILDDRAVEKKLQTAGKASIGIWETHLCLVLIVCMMKTNDRRLVYFNSIDLLLFSLNNIFATEGLT